MNVPWPIVFELVMPSIMLVGGVFLFGWWALRRVERTLDRWQREYDERRRKP